MSKAKVLLIASFVVTFAAGAAAGLLFSRVGPRPHGPSWLAAELELSDEQREQMQQIWSDVMRTEGRKDWDQRRTLSRQRDDAIVALLNGEQRPQYEGILADYTAQMDELEQQRKEVFERAVEQTKQILTPDQATKYEELMARRRERGPGDGPGRPPPWGRRPPSPSTEHERDREDRPLPRGRE